MRMLKRMRWMIAPVLICVAIILLMKTVLLLGYVPSASMEPTIPAESWILGLRLRGELETGAAVIFNRNGKLLVKRIAAVSGDTVYIDDNTHEVAVNSEPDKYTRALAVPVGCYLLLGDNADESIDARYWAEPFVREKDIMAALLWPEG
jgi:signal peptidase I